MKFRIRWAPGLLTASVLFILVACASPQPSETAGDTGTTQPPAATEQPAATPAAAGTEPASPAVEMTGTPTGVVTEPGTAQRGLFVNLTTDDTWSASMAISLAQTGLDKGLSPVVIFLNVRGVYLADKERLPVTEGNSDMNIHAKLQAFIAAGGQVRACPSCSREAGLAQADYIDGVVLGEPGGAFEFLSDPNITVISYPGRSNL